MLILRLVWFILNLLCKIGVVMLIPEKISSANKEQHKGSLEEIGYPEEISAFIDERERKIF